MLGQQCGGYWGNGRYACTGTWRKVEPPPAPEPVERKPRMSPEQRRARGDRECWGLYHDGQKTWELAGGGYDYVQPIGRPADHRRDYGTERAASANSDGGSYPRRFWRVRKPAAAPPRELCGAHCDAGLTRAVCDRPSGHLGPHSWQCEETASLRLQLDKLKDSYSDRLVELNAANDRKAGAEWQRDRANAHRNRAIDETADLRERLRVAEDALRLARADKERAEASAEDWKRLHEGADAERISFLTGELVAVVAERDRLRAELAARLERHGYGCNCVTCANQKMYAAMALGGAHSTGQQLASQLDGLAGRTAPVPHPANVMAAEAIAREAAPLRDGDRVQVSYSGRVSHIYESRKYMQVTPDATSGIPQSVHAEAVRRLPEPPK